MLTQSCVIRRQGCGPLQELGRAAQILTGDGEARQFEQPLDPLRLRTRRQLEVHERLRVVLLVAVVVGPVALDLRLVVVGPLLGELGAFVQLGLGVGVLSDVGEGFRVKHVGEGRGGRRLDGRGPVPRGRLDVVVPILDPGQDGQDEAVMGSNALGFLGFDEGGLLLGLVIEDQRIGGVVFGVLRMRLDQVLQLGGGRRISVLKHEGERRFGTRSAGLGCDRVAGGQQDSKKKDRAAPPPHGVSLSGGS